MAYPSMLLLSAMLMNGAQGFSSHDALAVNGHTIMVGTSEIRLAGIDGPDLLQYCLDEYKKRYACGRKATMVLNEALKGKSISCRAVSYPSSKYQVCTVDKTNISLELLEKGWAVFKNAAGIGGAEVSSYKERERFAKEKRAGLWSGDFVVPEKWREAAAGIKVAK